MWQGSPAPLPIRRYTGKVDETEVVSAVADLRAVRLDDMPLVPLEKIIQRVLPGTPVDTVKVGSGFASSI